MEKQNNQEVAVAANYPQKHKKRNAFIRNPFAIVLFVILIIYVISFLFPFLWVFVSSFKDGVFEFGMDKLTLKGMLSLPDKWLFSNYTTAYNCLGLDGPLVDGEPTFYGFWALMGNSLVYAFGSALIHTITCCCAAYAAAKYSKYVVCRMLYPIVIVTMVLPVVGSLGSTLKLMNEIGFYNNLFGLFAMKTGFLGQYFLIFYATFKGTSDGYAEAARIDGAGHMRIFLSIMLPLTFTTFLAIVLVTFIAEWNAWNVNIYYLPDFPMISYALYQIQQGNMLMKLPNGTVANMTNIPIQMASTILVTVPIVIVFVLLRKKLMGSLTVGGLKG